MASVDWSAFRMASDLGTNSPKMMVTKVMKTKAMIAARAGADGQLEQVGEGHGAQPAESEAGGGDAQLGGGQVGCQVLDDVVRYLRAPVAFGRQLSYAGLAHLDDGELGDDEERVHHDENDDADYLEGGAAHRSFTRGSGRGGVRRLREYAETSISLCSSIASGRPHLPPSHRSSDPSR